MKEDRKKISLLTRIDDIISDNCVNNNIGIYKFFSIKSILINGNSFNVSNFIVEFVLHTKEVIIKVYNKNNTNERCVLLPYDTIDSIHILLGDSEW